MHLRAILLCAALLLPVGLARPGESDRPKVLDLGNGVTMSFVRIPAGEFLMGSPETETGRRVDEGPQRPVRIARAFYVSATEVTQAQFQKVMGALPHIRQAHDLPVTRVSWFAAMDFCRILTARERRAGRLNDGEVYRLPTEAEWEYACRAGTTGTFSCSDDSGRLADYAVYDQRDQRGPSTVGTKRPNAFGLYDLHGNIWEWCLDWHGYPYPDEAETDALGPASGSRRVLRGGCWSNDWRQLRAACRNNTAPETDSDAVGFRAVRASADALPPEKYPANVFPVEVENEFTKQNPGYKTRAGASYEAQYLGKTVENLAKAANLDDRERAAAHAILRAFIYDWLDSYARGNGAIAAEDLQKHLALMDERFQGELDAAKYAKYLDWRRDDTGALNPLAFLMRPSAAPTKSIAELLDALTAAAKRGEGYVPIRIELAAIGAPAVEPLVRVIADDASTIQDHACWALYRVRDPAAVPLLIAHLKHPHPLVRQWCANTFAAMREPRAVDPLLCALDDANWEVRSSAAWALGHIKEAMPRALSPLMAMLKGDPRWEVRVQAAAALGRLAPTDPDVRAVLAATAGSPDEHDAVRKIAAKYVNVR